MLGRIRLNIEIDDMRKWNSFASVRRTLKAEFRQGHQITNNHIRFAIKPNQFLEVAEIPATDEFGAHFRQNISHTTVCLLLLKDDYSEMMFVRKEMGVAGNDVYRKYKLSCAKPHQSDVKRLQRLQSGNSLSFMSLFDTKEIVRRFYDKYKALLANLGGSIKGISSVDDRQHYSQILLSRIMFLYFIQSKKFLANESTGYLRNRFDKAVRAEKNFYNDFLLVLFFNVLNTERKNRKTDKFDAIPFLNGGLFKKHRIEEKYRKIRIENDVFDKVLKFLDGWMWYVDDTADDASTTASVNPEILGHIFETMIEDQNGQGAFYTPADITRYICQETIRPYCLDRVTKHFQTHYDEIRDILDNVHHAEYLYFDVIKGMRVLDPSCGSGEFVLTAYKTLYELYRETWHMIENLDTARVRNEKKRLGKNPNYYFKRRIITENLYGVDIDNGALEVCKLRLWLSLVADMDKENAEPLPNIDYNIMQGDSLVGYITPQAAQQLSIDEPERVSNILSEIEALKQRYRQEQEPGKAELLNKEIGEKIGKHNKRLNRAWISDISHRTRSSGIDVEEIKPFHWVLHFYNVITSGGFDIVVGNPPWLSTTADVSSKTRRPKLLKPVYDKLFKTKDAREHYAFFFEISLNMMKPGGRIGYIVALSSISLKTKKPLQEFLRNRCSELRISSYNDRPGKIFEGGTHARSAIVLGIHDIDGPCKILTTGSHRWKTKDRPGLLDRVVYLPCENFPIGDDCATTLYDEGIIPKFSVGIEKSIMAKFLSKPRLQTVNDLKFVLWYHDTARYWVRVTDYKFKDSHVHRISLDDEQSKIVTMALLNSSLAYWFFNKTTNNKEISSHIKHLCIDPGAFNSTDIEQLRRHTNKLYRHYGERYQAGEIKTDKVFCKSAIDKIDDILAKHYELTKEEIQYIKNFEVEFRMGTE